MTSVGVGVVWSVRFPLRFDQRSNFSGLVSFSIIESNSSSSISLSLLNNLGKAPLDGVLLGIFRGWLVKVTVSSAGVLYNIVLVSV